MTDSGDETRRPVAVDPHALQGYSTYPDPYGDLRRDYARVCAERDGLRVEVERLTVRIAELERAPDPANWQDGIRWVSADLYGARRQHVEELQATVDGLRWEQGQQHDLLVELRQALADLPIRHTFSLPCATRHYTGLIPPACTCGAAGLDAERMALITKIDTLFVG